MDGKVTHLIEMACPRLVDRLSEDQDRTSGPVPVLRLVPVCGADRRPEQAAAATGGVAIAAEVLGADATGGRLLRPAGWGGQRR